MTLPRAATVIVFVVALAITTNAGAQTATRTSDYLGQKPPGAEPVVFAPGIVSTGLSERDIAITPDGNEIYYGTYVGRYSFAEIMVVRRTGDAWGEATIEECQNGRNP